MARKLHMFSRFSLFLILALCAAAADDTLLVRVAPGQVSKIISKFNLTLVNQVVGGPATNLYLFKAAPNADLNAVAAQLNAAPGVQWVEVDQSIGLPKNSHFTQPASGQFGGTKDWANTLTPLGWSGYLGQPAGTTISLAGGHAYATGAGIVAFLDTGADFTNPVLAPSLVPGMDFTTAAGGIGQESAANLNQSTTSILDRDSMIELSQSTTSILDNSRPMPVNQSTTSILDQSTTSILDNGTPVPDAYGHGTMVAGLIHLVAPTARLMPVKVFTNSGTSSLATILNGIYYAASHGAKVINMSFSMTAPSKELQAALQAANAAGVICVAAVGNDGEQVVVYPAGYAEAMGVASTNNQGLRSVFTNYGTVVDLAAPGEEIVSTYPGNRYAAGWGTSFSTPLVSGGIALLLEVNPRLNQETASKAITQADPLGQQLGAGELDLVKALQYVGAHAGKH
jgi:subtilisin family serine protease